MTTTVEISIAGRGEADAPLLSDLIEQLQDYFAMISAVAETVTGDAVNRFDWQVVGLSKNSPARVIVEAIPLTGHADGPEIAAKARDLTNDGLRELIATNRRPVYFNDNVIDATDRFLKRITRGLAATTVGTGEREQIDLTIGTAAAIEGLRNLAFVREAEPVHPYRELGSFEGYIQNVGADGYGRPYVIIKSRLTSADVKCILTGSALDQLQDEPVANVVWRNRRVLAVGILKYRSVGKISQADISDLEFADPLERLPTFEDVIDRNFTGGLSSEAYLERLRDAQG